MGKYGQTAELAAKILMNPATKSPRDAWDKAVSIVFPSSESSREKGCPRDTFLSICGAGELRGVLPGTYTKSVKNKSYADAAMSLIRKNPNIVNDEKTLWANVTNNVGKTPNYQMDVVITLWQKGFLKP